MLRDHTAEHIMTRRLSMRRPKLTPSERIHQLHQRSLLHGLGASHDQYLLQGHSASAPQKACLSWTLNERHSSSGSRLVTRVLDVCIDDVSGKPDCRAPLMPVMTERRM